MASWHAQWMSAFAEVAALEDGPLKDMLRGWLSEARELIREDNGPSDRRCGGELVAHARLIVAEFPFGCVPDESAGLREDENG